ncbi:MAG TPA: serine/threonine-protein kinase [Kofleriaceae bacterium]|nr:serine/threonine-protein kinase [Kofleriaceae bacterium]
MKKPTPFGKYYLLERISIGGMAEVFRAKAFGVEGFERLVAVKRILPNIAEDKEFIRMFIEEAKLSVQLNHANIAQIFDLGVVEGSYYIALEHVHGRDLRVLFERCRQLGEAMPIAQACFVAMKVCEGLDYAHNKRDQAGRELALVHRDVSPQNILVSFEGEVKLIDFGIAKAAGIGANIQAPILKGKFGYMSPEQVRGVEIDRRSDVFSCGIVLYELLTGERLFVGESDFDTLEKVRNVEILPPSTYNRRIPDELERIVLKALSKDAEERYPNAIDLHDELQAFVYTAGEFYSRKDLAAWMKKTFGKEIEDETAKLESYRQLKPPPPSAALSPPASSPASPAPAEAVPEPARSQHSQAGKLPRKPPVQAAPVARPVKSTGPIAALKPPPPPVRPQAVVAAPPSVARSQPTTAPPPSVPVPGPAPSAMTGMGWEDDELETRVYDGDDPRHKSNRSGLPLQAPGASSPGIPLPAGGVALRDDGAPTQRPIEAQAWSPEPPPAEPFPLAPQPSSGSGGYQNGAAPGAYVGAHELGTPPPDMIPDPPILPPRREPAPAPARTTAPTYGASELPTIPVSSFGARITAGRRPRDGSGRLVPLAVGGAAVVAVVAILLLVVSGKPKPAPAPAATPAVAKPPAPPAPDPSTGFDLYVMPAGITQWKLDGDSRTDRLPSRIRGISPGPHTVQIEPPPGFLSQLQQVSVELGKAPKVEIALQPIPGITGVFESTPPGATVSLIIDGKREAVGPAPARAPLDPRNAYQVLFERPGYVSVNRPIAFSGALEEHVVVNLEKVSSSTPPPPAPPPPSPPSHASAPDPRPRRTGESSAPAADDGDVKGKAQGVLVLGSKPPCDIAIDGSTTGLHTPQKEIKLPVGRHRITLTNAEFGINETFTVDIKADAPEKLIKDYSDRLPN